jgi:hypothetical protein
MKKGKMDRVGFAILIAIAAVIVVSTVVMLLWNGLMPDLFGLRTISFFQAMGLLILSHLLLRGWSPMHHFRGWKHERLRNLLDSRLSTMTPEEREKFAAEWGCHRSNPPKTDAKVVS